MNDRLRLTGPTNCSLNVTNRCNLTCLHCSASANSARSDEMSFPQIVSLLDSLERIGLCRIDITGGEPLVREDLFEILAILKSKRIPAKLLTNATLITSQVAQRLLREAHITDVAVSLDGAGPDTHDALRGRGAFERTTRGIRALKEAGFRVHAGCVVSRLNMHELSEIAGLAKALGMTIVLDSVSPVGRALANRDAFSFTRAEQREVFFNVVALMHEHDNVSGGTVLEWPIGKIERSHGLPPLGRPGRHLAHCSICKESVAIAANGDVIPCNNFQGYILGNVLHQDILEIYHSESARRIRELSTLTSDQLDGCQDCDYAGYCGGGCRALAYLATGSLKGADPTRCIRQCMEDRLECESKLT